MGTFSPYLALQRWPESGALGSKAATSPAPPTSGRLIAHVGRRPARLGPQLAVQLRANTCNAMERWRLAATPSLCGAVAGSYQAGSKPSSNAQLAATRDRTPREAPRRQRLI
jgi:hypothetical protein